MRCSPRARGPSGGRASTRAGPPSAAAARAARCPPVRRAWGRSAARGRRGSPGGGRGETSDVETPPLPPETLVPEPIALAIVFEDEAVLVVDKPVGMVVHPGAGHATGTLAAAVLAHAPSTAGVGGPRRPGVVHRLPHETTGLLPIAQKAAAHHWLPAP